MKTVLSSTDVWFCAFLMQKGIKIHSYDVVARGKVKCHFELTQDEWQKYKVEFNNSDLIKYKHTIDSIKDLSF